MGATLNGVFGFLGAGGVVGVIGLLYARRQSKVSARDEARDEAVQLAEVRRQMIAELTGQLAALRNELHAVEKKYAEEVAALKLTIEQVRREATEAQRTLAGSVRLSLRNVRSHLEADPPNIASALHDLRDLLDGDVSKR